MTKYTYSINDKDTDRVSVQMFERGPIARSIIMKSTSEPDFENYSIDETHRGLGLSYALTHLMHLYCKDKNKLNPTVMNAHGVLIPSLEKVGFTVVNRRYDPSSKQNAASLKCEDINRALSSCKVRMIQKSLIQDGLRNVGPYTWRS